MTFYKPVEVSGITQDQIKKASKGKAITLSKSQLQGTGTKIYVHSAVHKNVQAARKKGSGVRIHWSPEGAMTTADMEGGSLGDWIKKAWGFVKKDLWPAIKPAVSGVLDAAVAPVSQALGPYGSVVAPARGAIKNLTGVGVSAKKMGKGSEAAKAHMAMLRARRGGSFRLS